MLAASAALGVVLAAACVAQPAAAFAAAGNQAPDTPTALSTSPSTACPGDTVVGHGDITLRARVSDPDGGVLGAQFRVVEHGPGGAVVVDMPEAALHAASGTDAVFVVQRAVLDAAAADGAVTEFDWKVRVSDADRTSSWSATCHFSFDRTYPAAPVVADPGPATVGEPVTLSVTAAPGSTPAASYAYLVDGGSHGTVGADADGSAAFTVTPDSGAVQIAVTAFSPGGNHGGTTTFTLFSTVPVDPPTDPPTGPSTTDVHGDLNGDGRPDLTVVGAQAGLPSGLWFAPGLPGNRIDTAATDIGAQGTGIGSADPAADWDGTQVVTGHFANGAGSNDVLSYNPVTGSGAILYGNGDGSVLSPTSGHEVNVSSLVFEDSITGARATSVANGGGLYNTLNGAPVNGFPNLLLVVGGVLLDEGSALIPGAFTGVDGAIPVSSTNPAGTGDWTGWTLTTGLIDGLPALFARDTAGGALYYYTPEDLENLALGSPATPVQLAASGWDAADAPVLQAADIDGDGTPDLWKVDATGTVTAYLFDGTALTAQAPQQLAAVTAP